MLLASMSRKITLKPATAPASTKKKVELLPRLSGAPQSRVMAKTNRQLIKNQPKLPSSSITVKPLIINLTDSDSESEAAAMQKKIITNNVAAFLKKQRAEVERAALSDSPFLDKSALKLLPKSQQLEYRKLKQKLLNAAKKKSVATVPHVVCGEIKQANKVPTKKLNNLSPIKHRYSVVNPNKLVMNKSPPPKQSIAKLAAIDNAKRNNLAKLNMNRPLSSEKSMITSASKATVTDTDNAITVNSQTSESSKDDQDKKGLYHMVSMLRKILTELQIRGKARKNGRYWFRAIENLS